MEIIMSITENVFDTEPSIIQEFTRFSIDF